MTRDCGLRHLSVAPIQAQKKLVRDKIQVVSAIAGSSLPAVTPHQAAILSKKMVLLKRYSATEAMQIHAAAAAAVLAESEQELPTSQVVTVFASLHTC